MLLKPETRSMPLTKEGIKELDRIAQSHKSIKSNEDLWLGISYMMFGLSYSLWVVYNDSTSGLTLSDWLFQSFICFLIWPFVCLAQVFSFVSPFFNIVVK